MSYVPGRTGGSLCRKDRVQIVEVAASAKPQLLVVYHAILDVFWRLATSSIFDPISHRYADHRNCVWNHGLGRDPAHRTPWRNRHRVVAHQRIRPDPRSHGRVLARLSRRSLVREGTHSALPRRRPRNRASRRPAIPASSWHQLSSRRWRRSAPILQPDRREIIHRRLTREPNDCRALTL